MFRIIQTVVTGAFALAMFGALSTPVLAGPAGLAGSTPAQQKWDKGKAVGEKVHYRKKRYRRHRNRRINRYRRYRGSVGIGIYLGRPAIRYNPYYRPYNGRYFGYGRYPAGRHGSIYGGYTRGYNGYSRGSRLYLRGPQWDGSNR